MPLLDLTTPEIEAVTTTTAVIVTADVSPTALSIQQLDQEKPAPEIPDDAAAVVDAIAAAAESSTAQTAPELFPQTTVPSSIEEEENIVGMPEYLAAVPAADLLAEEKFKGGKGAKKKKKSKRTISMEASSSKDGDLSIKPKTFE